jgi:hypothetical protein
LCRQTHEEFVPFPTEYLPGPLRELVEAGARSMLCDASMIALPLLSATAAMIGTTRVLRLKGSWDVPAVLWTAVVAPSGSLKTPAWSLAMHPVEQIDRELQLNMKKEWAAYKGQKTEWKAQLTAWKQNDCEGAAPSEPERPPRTRIRTSDATVEALIALLAENPRGLLVSVDELSGWLGSFGRYSGSRADAEVATWLPMYNAKSIQKDRQSGDQPSLFVPIAAVSVCGGIQPGVLARQIGNQHVENGLLSRLLLSCPPQQRKVWTDDEVPFALISNVTDLFRRLRSLDFDLDRNEQPVPRVLKLTPDGMKLWQRFYNAHNEQVDHTSGMLRFGLAKLEEVPARLALVLHLARWAAGEHGMTTEIDSDSLQAGISLAEWFKRETRRTYAAMRHQQTHAEHDELVDWIAARGGHVSIRELQQGRREFDKAEEAERALNRLVAAGRGHWVPVPPGPQGGQPTQRFHLSV